MDRAYDRRGFLRRSASPQPPSAVDLMRLSRPAMGTVFEVLAPASLARPRLETVLSALDEIRRLERIMSHYSEFSRVTELNRDASQREVPVETELMEVLQLGQSVWQETNGAFDFAAGALWKAWGFFQKEGHVLSDAELSSARARSGAGFVVLDAQRTSVRFLRPGIEINLGSIGKGFALDRAGAILHNADLESALLHAGHSSFLALGDSVPGSKGWRVSLRHPVAGDEDVAWLQLRNQGMATSGGRERFFEADGKRYPHILDPRTGVPARRYLSVTAFAPGAGLADALSTAFFVMAEEEIEAVCTRRPEWGAIVLIEDGSGRDFRALKFGCAKNLVVKELPGSGEVEF